MDALLQRRDVLRCEHHRLDVAGVDGRRWLAAQSAFAAAPVDTGAPPTPSFDARQRDGRLLRLHAVPLVESSGRLLPPSARLLLIAIDDDRKARVDVASLRARFGMTAAEARLSALLAGGATLRAAADMLGITYGTARGYLKLAFDKPGVHSQAQLVSRIV